jgi:hypothetical protein
MPGVKELFNKIYLYDLTLNMFDNYIAQSTSKLAGPKPSHIAD